MIYVFIVLAFCAIEYFIAQYFIGKLEDAKREADRLRAQIDELVDIKYEMQTDIRELVEGGLIQQEKVTEKYKKKYKEREDNNRLALEAQRLQMEHMRQFQQKQSGLSHLYSHPPFFGRL